MGTPLEHILTNSYKDSMIAYLRTHPSAFDEALVLAVSNRQPYSWRASWVLWSCMEKNDPRVRKFLNAIIRVLPSVQDNQARELLIILQKMELRGKQEGLLFDLCISLWKRIDKQPSLRINALKVLMQIVQRHPELAKEVLLLTESRYLNTLSPGVKNSVMRLTNVLQDEGDS